MPMRMIKVATCVLNFWHHAMPYYYFYDQVLVSISAREDRSTGLTGNSDDQCIKEICCQGELVYAFVNTSCSCPPEGILVQPNGFVS